MKIVKMTISAKQCVLGAVLGIGLAVAGCGGKAVSNAEKDALARHHTTCLKRGLAADTRAHADCVLALHEEERRRAVQVRGAVTPSE